MRSIYWQVLCAECSAPIGWMTGGMLPYVICSDCKEKQETGDSMKGDQK